MAHDDARVHGSTEQDLVFIVHGHYNEKFRIPAIEVRPKAVLGAHEIVGVASGGSVTYLGHFFNVVHASRNNVGGDLDVKDKVSVLKRDMPDRPTFHQLFPCHGVAGGHGGRVYRRSKILGRRVIRLVRKRRRDHLILAARVKINLGVIGMKGPVGLCLPVVLLVVVVGMVGGGRWRIIRKNKSC